MSDKHSAWMELLRILVSRNLKIRYKGSVLGFLWSLLTPLSMICIYAIFAGVLGMKRDLLGISGTFSYLPFLVSGIVVWQFTAGCLSDSMHAISGNANLVKKVYFPRAILPLSTVLANAVNFGVSFAALVVYLAIDGSLCLSHAWWLIPAFAMQLVLCSGLAMLVSTANVYFRDTEHIVGLVLLAWFFLSPVMYEISLQLNAVASMAEAVRGLVCLNPMTGVLTFYRRALLGMDLAPIEMDPAWLGLSAAMSVFVFVLGWITLKNGDRRFGDVL